MTVQKTELALRTKSSWESRFLKKTFGITPHSEQRFFSLVQNGILAHGSMTSGKKMTFNALFGFPAGQVSTDKAPVDLFGDCRNDVCEIRLILEQIRKSGLQ